MQLLDDALLTEISRQAKLSPRLRMNFNLHHSPNDKAQRLFNALEPGTVIPIHRHVLTAETYIVLKGKLEVYTYEPDGKQRQKFCLEGCTANFGVQINAGEWHSLKVLEANTVIFEVKDGPYTPLSSQDMLEIK